MSQLISSFLPGLLALVAHALLLVAALRRRWPKSPMAAHLGCGVIGIAAVLAITFFGAFGAALWPSLALFAFGWTLLLFVYSILYKSVSLRLLLITAQEASPPSYAALTGRVLRKGFDERIDLLVARGLVEEREGNYRLTSAGRKTAAFIEKLRNVFAATTSGMYEFSDPDRRGS